MLSGFGQALIDRTEERLYKEAYMEAYKEAQKETVRLMSYLSINGRSDDIIKAASDPSYLKMLFKEYHNTEEYKAMLQNKQKELEAQVD